MPQAWTSEVLKDREAGWGLVRGDSGVTPRVIFLVLPLSGTGHGNINLGLSFFICRKGV